MIVVGIPLRLGVKMDLSSNKFLVGSTVLAAYNDENCDDKDYGFYKLDHWNEYYEYDTGIIVELLPDNKARVAWEEADDTLDVDMSLLVAEEDWDEITNQLHADFKAVIAKVTAKMKEAAKVIDEGIAIAEEAGYEMNQMHEAMYPISGKMHYSGWQSSISCY
jgi:hypothetical protein